MQCVYSALFFFSTATPFTSCLLFDSIKLYRHMAGLLLLLLLHAGAIEPFGAEELWPKLFQ
jgi:hypothetical protein